MFGIIFSAQHGGSPGVWQASCMRRTMLVRVGVALYLSLCMNRCTSVHFCVCFCLVFLRAWRMPGLGVSTCGQRFPKGFTFACRGFLQIPKGFEVFWGNQTFDPKWLSLAKDNPRSERCNGVAPVHLFWLSFGDRGPTPSLALQS